MASIAAIIPADRARIAVTIVSVLIGVVLIGLAWGRVVDEMALLKPASVLAALEAGIPVTAAEISGAARAAQAAEDGPVGARASRIAGQLHMAAAARLGGTATLAGLAEYDRAAAQFASALADAPADRFAWWWLVSSRWNSAQHLAAAQAWRAAALSGLFDPELMFARVEGALALWPYLDISARQALGAQLTVHWQWGPDGLAELLARFGARDVLREALTERPDIAEDLGRRMAGRR